jgi:hypothetical protein
MQHILVVILDEGLNDPTQLVFGDRSAGIDGLPFDRFVPTLDLAVGLRMVRTGEARGDVVDLEEFQEPLGSEGAAVIGDERGLLGIVKLAGFLDDELGLESRRLGIDAEAEDGAAVAVDDRDEVVVAVSGLDRSGYASDDEGLTVDRNPCGPAGYALDARPLLPSGLCRRWRARRRSASRLASCRCSGGNRRRDAVGSSCRSSISLLG